VNAVLFRPLPVERPAELVNIYGHTATASTHDTHSYPNYLEYRRQTTTLSGLVAYTNFFAHASFEGSADLVLMNSSRPARRRWPSCPTACGRRGSAAIRASLAASSA
jgi:hypothetical protein